MYNILRSCGWSDCPWHSLDNGITLWNSGIPTRIIVITILWTRYRDNTIRKFEILTSKIVVDFAWTDTQDRCLTSHESRHLTGQTGMHRGTILFMSKMHSH